MLSGRVNDFQIPAVKTRSVRSFKSILLADLKSGMRVLDIGCGNGELMADARALGCDVEGVDVDPELVATCRRRGLRVHQAGAEQLPFKNHRFDAIICGVVLPYTEDQQAIAEWARVLKPGGKVNMTTHGLGYGLSYLFSLQSPRRSFYGLRMLVNTAIFQLTGKRLKGFWGDTICQSRRRLHRLCTENNLLTVSELQVGHTLGLPRVIGLQLRHQA